MAGAGMKQQFQILKQTLIQRLFLNSADKMLSRNHAIVS